MGSRGVAPTPRAVLEARGSPKAASRTNDLELPSSNVEPPVKLEGEALAQWKAVVDLLAPRGALTEGDRMALTMLCELWAEDRQLADAMKAQEVGSLEWKRIRNGRTDVRKQLVVMFTKFGLTPVDRPRVKVNKPKERDDPAQHKPRLVG